MREGIGAAPEPFEARLEQTSLLLVKATFDDASFQDAISQGRLLSTEEAIAEALELSWGPSDTVRARRSSKTGAHTSPDDFLRDDTEE
jgi:hypothetical protein